MKKYILYLRNYINEIDSHSGMAEGESATYIDIIEEINNSAIFTTKFTAK